MAKKRAEAAVAAPAVPKGPEHKLLREERVKSPFEGPGRLVIVEETRNVGWTGSRVASRGWARSPRLRLQVPDLREACGALVSRKRMGSPRSLHEFGPALACPLCGKKTVVALTPRQLAGQIDGTTHVCHPAVGGCNHGFELEVRS